MLQHPERFFASLRAGLLGPTLSQDEVDGCNAILEACAAWPLSWAAYGLATAFHETAHTLQPIRENGSPAYFRRMYDIEGLRPHVAAQLGNTQFGDGARFYGRGYPQLTGRTNYTRADRELGLDGALLANPDLALEPPIAAAILRRGMEEGWFGGAKLERFLPLGTPATRAEFMAARRIINGTDRADLIADIALAFQTALQVGGWCAPAEAA